MKIKITLSHADAEALDEMFARGELAALGVRSVSPIAPAESSGFDLPVEKPPPQQFNKEDQVQPFIVTVFCVDPLLQATIIDLMRPHEDPSPPSMLEVPGALLCVKHYGRHGNVYSVAFRTWPDSSSDWRGAVSGAIDIAMFIISLDGGPDSRVKGLFRAANLDPAKDNSFIVTTWTGSALGKSDWLFDFLYADGYGLSKGPLGSGALLGVNLTKRPIDFDRPLHVVDAIHQARKPQSDY